MKQNKKPTIKYRKDYKVPSHLIDTTDLYFDLNEDVTIVTNHMHIRKNPASSESGDILVLDGKEQKLVSIKIDNQTILDRRYELTDETLTIVDFPESGELEITTEIKPQDNTVLMGLYKSSGIYCTQCESEGFRRITYFLDRPDVLSKFTTTIAADKKSYPILLSNGNLVDSGDSSGGRHWIKWEDPFLKPCYLFAAVAGDLEFIEDHFVTCSDRKITLRLFCEKGNRDKCFHAMDVLKQAMRWDEEKYGREYDLDLFMILAVDDFNVGAMENKGLNIFNSSCVFARSDTATDAEYGRIAGVVAHEYFHNWSGDRVTCRDWFQLSLKEGLTVFRDQTFSEDMTSQTVSRIEQVQRLRELQFPEDAGPLAHSVRPDSYMEIDNFYTMTIYEKGAEVIRMMRVLLGLEGFRRGMDLYFERHDGQAVTCDDFVKAMEDSNKVDFSQFRLWYSQAGTPALHIEDEYDAVAKEYTLCVTQHCPDTPNQSNKKPMHIPLAVGLLTKEGHDIPLMLKGSDEESSLTHVLSLREKTESFVFTDMPEKPIPSLLRGFSAPVKLDYDYSNENLAFIMAHDSDAFGRWEAGQRYAVRLMLDLIKKIQNKKPLELSAAFVSSFKSVLESGIEAALVAQMMQLPTETFLAECMDIVDPDSIFAAREFMMTTLAEKLKSLLMQLYNAEKKPYEYTITAVGTRSLKNMSLQYLMRLDEADVIKLCVQQFDTADNMTDRFAALTALVNSECSEKTAVLDRFYDRYHEDPLMIDKWLRVQALSTAKDTLSRVQKLLEHPAFNIKNPNRTRSLLVNFSRFNPVRFHDISGEGYELLANQIIRLDKLNPHMSARILAPLSNWKRYDGKRQKLMRAELERILLVDKLSKNVYELVSKSMG